MSRHPRPGASDLAHDRQERDRRTQELLTRAKRCASPAEVAELHEEVVRLHLPVARGAASRYRNRGVAAEDLEQIACTGLVAAVKRYDPERGESFLGFALPTVHGYLKRHFRDQGWAVRPPRRIQELQASIARQREQLTQSLGRSPRPAELATELGVDEDDVIEALAAQGCFTPASLDRPVGSQPGDSTEPLAAYLVGDDGRHRAAEARLLLGPAVRVLSERDRRVIALRFFEQRTQREIGDEIGVTQIQVSRLLTRILRDLRRALVAADEEPSSRAS